MNGIVKKLTIDKGYGFILGDNKKEYFFHMSALKNVSMGELQEGREVTFEDTEGQKGPRAEDIYV